MADPTIWDEPGLFTCADGHGVLSPAEFYALGYRWIVGQAQNGADLHDVDLTAFRRAGFQTGVWGVTYKAEDFQRDAQALTAQALKTHSDLVVIDAEQCLKNADPWPIIYELAATQVPCALSTLGAASGLNTFPIDYAGFVTAGFHILPQAYYMQDVAYEPAHCYEHARRAGVPDRLVHLTVDSSDEFGPMDAANLVRLLKASPCKRGVSVFMAECGTPDFYRTLGQVTVP